MRDAEFMEYLSKKIKVINEIYKYAAEISDTSVYSNAYYNIPRFFSYLQPYRKSYVVTGIEIDTDSGSSAGIEIGYTIRKTDVYYKDLGDVEFFNLIYEYGDKLIDYVGSKKRDDFAKLVSLVKQIPLIDNISTTVMVNDNVKVPERTYNYVIPKELKEIYIEYISVGAGKNSGMVFAHTRYSFLKIPIDTISFFISLMPYLEDILEAYKYLYYNKVKPIIDKIANILHDMEYIVSPYAISKSLE